MQTKLPHPTFISILRAIYHVARVDWRQYWRYPLNALSRIFEPIVWLTPVYFMGQAFSTNGVAKGFAAYSGVSDYMSFILIGTALSNFIGAVFWGMGFSLKNDMDTGVLESNWLTPMPRPLLLFGHTLSSMLITTILGTGILLLGGLIFGLQVSGNAAMALLNALPMLIGLYGFGFVFAAIVLLVREANNMVDMSNFLVQTLSGAQFPVQSMPRWLLPFSLALPLTYGFDAVRGWLLGTKTLLPLNLEFALLCIFMVVFIWLGLWAFRRLERHVRSLGTLGQH